MVCYPDNILIQEAQNNQTPKSSIQLVTKWYHGVEKVAPPALTVLVTKAVDELVPLGKIFGYFISCNEPNDFRLQWTSGTARSMLVCLPSGGTIVVVLDYQCLNEKIEAALGTVITIKNVTAGAAGKLYQAGVLLA